MARDRYGKAIRTFYTQDQASKKPLIALAAYSGTTISRVTRQLATLTRAILQRDFLMVADKEWYCGQLIQDLHAQYGVEILTPVKSSPKRQAGFHALPLEQYDQTVWGNIAAVYTTMTDFDGPLRMLLKKRRNGTYFALLTPACDMTADTAMPTYTKRWRIENFFAENTFLVAAILTNLDTKLESAGVDPRIPWLGNRRLRFTFH